MKYQVTLNGKIYEVDVTETEAAITAVSQAAAPAPAAQAAAVPDPVPASDVQSAVAGEKVTSPMPGTILAVNVAVGQSVRSGDVLFVLEAMKMENEIVAPCDGTVKQLLAGKGAAVNTDDVLAVI